MLGCSHTGQDKEEGGACFPWLSISWLGVSSDKRHANLQVSQYICNGRDALKEFINFNVGTDKGNVICLSLQNSVVTVASNLAVLAPPMAFLFCVYL